MPASIRTRTKRNRFITALENGASVTKACEAARISRRAAYDWRREDSQFSADWDDAIEGGTDRLEDIATQRAQESSDTLLMFLLKGKRPEVYGEKRQITGANGQPLIPESLTNLEIARCLAFIMATQEQRELEPPTIDAEPLETGDSVER